MSFLGNLTAKQFLRGYWQKKPLLIRQALPDFASPYSPEELAGLACEEEIESRIITTTDNKDCPWQLRNGPFLESDFATLGEKNWTLLVQDCQRYSSEVAALLTHFNFIPQWRLDDIMISYATEGGSVGPHIDQYDVFLIQGKGERRWQIDSKAISEDNLYAGCELDILKDFTPDEEWVLSPGDMLYLPPQLAHYGVAMNDCMTLSVGFRAPSHQEMVTAYLDDMYQHVDQKQRFSDPHRGVPENISEIDVEDIAQFVDVLKHHINDNKRMADIFGRLVTETKQPDWFTPTEISKASLVQHGIVIDPDARLAFVREHYYHIRLFANGESLEVCPPAAHLVPLLCDNRMLRPDDYHKVIDTEEFNQLVDFLMENGLIAHDD